MYRFALRPRWIVSHLVVLALVVTMLNLGLWQLRRLDEKRDFNDLVRSRTAQPVASGDDLPRPRETDLVDALEFRRVGVSGRFLADAQVLVRGRSLDDSPGSWVLAPLQTDDGTLVIVNRGWIANSGTFDTVPAQYAPPAGDVAVAGIVMSTQTRGRFGPTDPPAGRLTSLARVDIARYARQLDAPVVPVWVQQRSIAPEPAASATVPRTLGLPELDEGPHFGYAMQWFIFTAIALIGYPLILRRNARERLPGDRIAGHALVDPDGPDSADVVEPDDPRLEARPS